MRSLITFLIGIYTTALAAAPAAPKPLKEWNFNEGTSWSGWSPTADIKGILVETDAISFKAVGSDPIILSPLFTPVAASNTQWVEIELDTDSPGQGELFYTNTTAEPYSGFRGDWMSEVSIPSTGRQKVIVWPFWSSLKQIIRLRLDPPSGVHCRLRSIRIVETEQGAAEPKWNYTKAQPSWLPLHAARLEAQKDGLILHAEAPDAVVFMPVKSFAAAERSILNFHAIGNLESVTVAWSSSEFTGLVGEPIVSKLPLRTDLPLDLRVFPNWKGTITGLALAFGVRKGDHFTLRTFSVDKNDPSQPLLRLRSALFRKELVRASGASKLHLVVEHIAGPAFPSGDSVLMLCGAGELRFQTLQVPAIEPGQQVKLTTSIVAHEAGQLDLALHLLPNQDFQRSFHVAPVLAHPPEIGAYAVPEPRPVKSDYDIGVYYFPGWSGKSGAERWQKQAGFPDRDPLLGWYREGEPEVADWHIKWAVENGIRFFVYDWYWRKDHEELGEGLSDGFLKARYNGLMKFAVMWANHAPFADHTPEQLLQVTDYWIEHYFRRPNYWTYKGEPYVSFFSPGELIRSLGTEEKVKVALQQMRDRVKAAGLPGLHIAACTGGARGPIESLGRCGFDSITGYNYPRAGAFLAQSPYEAFILAHQPIWQSIEAMNVLPYVPLLTVNWDARPWHGPATDRRFLRSTHLFREGLRRLKAHLDKTGGRAALIEAWNEWGEGAYLEPNREFGFGDIEALREVFALPGDWPQNLWPGDLHTADKYDIRFGKPAK